jgi:hypothetical protein
MSESSYGNAIHAVHAGICCETLNPQLKIEREIVTILDKYLQKTEDTIALTTAAVIGSNYSKC